MCDKNKIKTEFLTYEYILFVEFETLIFNFTPHRQNLKNDGKKVITSCIIGLYTGMLFDVY